MRKRILSKLVLCVVMAVSIVCMGLATASNVKAETDYTIIDASADASNPTPLSANGVMYAAEFESDAALYFTLTTGAQAGYYYFYIYNASCDRNICMQLSDSATSEEIFYKGSFTTNSSSSKNLKLLTNKTYNFKIYNSSDRVITGYVKYYVKFVPDTVGDTKEEARTVTIGQTVSGNIGGDEDVDYYAVTTGSAGMYELSGQSIANSYGDVKCECFYITNVINQEISYFRTYYSQNTVTKEVSLLANTTYYIKVEGVSNNGQEGDYQFSLSYKVNKPSVSVANNVKLKASKNKLKLTWSKVSKAKGYQIQYSTKKNFKNAKTREISKSKKSYTIKNLKSKKKYYVRIRAYKTYTNATGKTVRAYGRWVKVSKRTK